MEYNGSKCFPRAKLVCRHDKSLRGQLSLFYTHSIPKQCFWSENSFAKLYTFLGWVEMLNSRQDTWPDRNFERCRDSRRRWTPPRDWRESNILSSSPLLTRSENVYLLSLFRLCDVGSLRKFACMFVLHIALYKHFNKLNTNKVSWVPLQKIKTGFTLLNPKALYRSPKCPFYINIIIYRSKHIYNE